MNRKIRLLTLFLCFLFLVSATPTVAQEEMVPSFRISVDNVTFLSNEPQETPTWSFDPATQSLSLGYYQGGAIKADGNLTIYTSGFVSVTAPEDSGESGISVNGDLTLQVSGSLTVRGADSATAPGGHGIFAYQVSLTGNANSSIDIYAGNSEAGKGGIGIYSDTVTLKTPRLSVVGGNAASGIYFSTSFSVAANNYVSATAGTGAYAVTYAGKAKYTIPQKLSMSFPHENRTLNFLPKSQIVYGDIAPSTPAAVNTQDAILLAQYLATWPVTFSDLQYAAADVYYDGTVNSRDAIRLAQHLAQWPVKLGH